ncbi:hypothetical protein AB0H76_32075 [Nocardia sp. NPDC050712]|uniref:hypothetical protein n=1 Tax=Nocardia sp. NPDC050712 TaxID=3155518 RepID=UPI00340C9F36
MYTLLFLLTLLCVLTVLLSGRAGPGSRALWTMTLIAVVAASVPHVADHTFSLEF